MGVSTTSIIREYIPGVFTWCEPLLDWALTQKQHRVMVLRWWFRSFGHREALTRGRSLQQGSLPLSVYTFGEKCIIPEIWNLNTFMCICSLFFHVPVNHMSEYLFLPSFIILSYCIKIIHLAWISLFVFDFPEYDLNASAELENLSLFLEALFLSTSLILSPFLLILSSRLLTSEVACVFRTPPPLPCPNTKKFQPVVGECGKREIQKAHEWGRSPTSLWYLVCCRESWVWKMLDLLIHRTSFSSWMGRSEWVTLNPDSQPWINQTPAVGFVSTQYAQLNDRDVMVNGFQIHQKENQPRTFYTESISLIRTRYLQNLTASINILLLE